MKLGVTLDILNQKDTPAFYADTLANRPAAGFTGRVFISTDTLDLYRDTGTTWVLLSPSSTGTITGSGAAGQVTYFSAASSITGSNDLFFDSVNGHLGIGTITPSTALTIFHDQNQIIQINQTTATNDTKIAFQNSGTPLWRIGNSYNAGANDWGIFDVVGSIQPLTIKKTTGQTFIGSQTTSSGLLVVNSSTADNQIVAIGANAPSIRVRNAGTAPTQQFGLGLATGVNNFIQGSASGDFCLFNGSTTASPILFGVYSTTNVVEAARISSAFNLLVGGVVDNGRKLQVTGDASFSTNGLFGGSNNPGNAGAYTVSVGVPGSTAGGIQLWAATNQTHYLQFGDGSPSADNYRGSVGYNHNTDSLTLGTASVDRLTITNTGNVGIGISTGFNADSAVETTLQIASINLASLYLNSTTSNKWSIGATGSGNLNFQNLTTSTIIAQISTAGNVLIGTTTDGGQKLQVNGAGYISSSLTTSGITCNGNLGIGLATADVIGYGTGNILGILGAAGNPANIQLGIVGTAGATNTPIGDYNSFGFNGGTSVVARTIMRSSLDGATNSTKFDFFTMSSGTITSKMTIKSNGVINMSNLPTSAVGLVSGDIYSNAGILTIVP